MKKYIILIPVYNDWQSVFKLIQNIDLQLSDEIVDILIVNDASTEKYEGNLTGTSKIKSVKIINLNILPVCTVTAMNVYYIGELADNLYYKFNLSDCKL